MSADDLASATVYMDALLTPNRSLSRRGLAALMAVVVAYNLLIAIFLVAIGAFPVPVFLGLDVAGLLIAFRVSNRRSGRAERVHVTADQVRVFRRHAEGREHTVWTSPTAFTRVALDHAGQHEAQVRLRLSGRTLDIGSSLSPQERSSFADALDRAIHKACAERRKA